MQIIISMQTHGLETILKQNRNFSYLYFGDADPSVTRSLSSLGLQEIIPRYSTDDHLKEAFVQEYIDLIGITGKKCDSPIWNSTFIASKNKFVSPLFKDLFAYLSIIDVIKQKQTEDLIIFDPPSVIIPSLLDYCKKNEINLVGTPSTILVEVTNLRESAYVIVARVRFLIRMWGKILISRYYFSSRIRISLKKHAEYYLLRSTFYERTISGGNYLDSFFGVLPDFIARKKNVLILAGPIGNYHAIARKIAAERNHLIVTEDFFLSFLDPIRTIIFLLRHPVRIPDNTLFLNMDVTRILQARIDEDCRFNVCDQFIFTYLIRNLGLVLHPESFTTTFENNPWEKVIFGTLREVSPDTYIIGYQHAALSKSSLNMVLSEEETGITPVPDRIITIGKVTRDFLIRVGGYHPAIVMEGCGLRFSHLFSTEQRAQTRNNNILVTPEGILSESVRLANFVHRALQDTPDVRIILRPHPALPFKEFCKYLDFDAAVSPKFSISGTESVYVDLAKADIVIFRGSTLALEALKMGIPAIYLDFSDIISVNPLFGSGGLCWVARTEKELQDVIEIIYGMSGEEYTERNRVSQLHINDYIARITDDRMSVFLP